MSAFRDTHPGIDWKAIEGLRHVLVHDYYNVDLSKVWVILVSDLPGFKEYIISNI